MFYPQVSSKVYHDSFCQLDSSVSLPWVIYLEALFYMLYPQVSSKIYHDSFCQSDSSVSLPWAIYFEAFYLHVVSTSLFKGLP